MGRNELQKLLDQKKANREKLFAKYWPDLKAKTPLLVVIDENEVNSNDLVFKLLEGLKVLNGVVVVVSNEPSSPKNENLSTKIVWVNAKTTKIEPILFAADMGLTLNAEHNTLQKFLDHGVVPVGLEKSPLLSNYHPNDETGNSFTYKTTDAWDIFSAVVRAGETFKFPYDWEHIIRGMLKVR